MRDEERFVMEQTQRRYHVYTRDKHDQPNSGYPWHYFDGRGFSTNAAKSPQATVRSVLSVIEDELLSCGSHRLSRIVIEISDEPVSSTTLSPPNPDDWQVQFRVARGYWLIRSLNGKYIETTDTLGQALRHYARTRGTL